jgi:chromosome segregation ATPase
MSDRHKSLLDALRPRGYPPGFMARCEIYGEAGEMVSESQKEIDRLRAELAEANERTDRWKFTAEQREANWREVTTELAEANEEIARLREAFQGAVSDCNCWQCTALRAILAPRPPEGKGE